MLQCGAMASDSLPESSSYRVTLFFGPEPSEEGPDTLVCVFNVKKRSWKAGIQVAIEIDRQQLSAIRQQIGLDDRLAALFSTLGPDERPAYEARVPDFFAQAVSRCKLDLRLQSGLTQENQRIPAAELVPELARSVNARREYVVTYILTELDLAPDRASPSSL